MYWSSDVCSSDLYAGNVARAVDAVPEQVEADPDVAHAGRGEGAGDVVDDLHARPPCARRAGIAAFGDPACGIGGPSAAGRAARITAFLRECPIDRKSVVWGKSVSVRVDLGGRRIIKKKK